jgi:hypothetical protein
VKNALVSLALLTTGVPIGWGLGALREHRAEAQPPQEFAARGSPRVHRADPTGGEAHAPKPWKCSEVNLDELQGFHRVRTSPVPRMYLWVRGDAGSDPHFAMLCRWLGLPDDHAKRLAVVLAEATSRQLDWERRNLSRETVSESTCRISWRPSAEVTRWLQSRLIEEFGEPLAKAIWLKGDLENFARPRPVLDEDHGTLHLSVHLVPPSKIDIMVAGDESGRAIRQQIEAPLGAEIRPDVPLREVHRFVHLVPREMARNPRPRRERAESVIPVADLAEEPRAVPSRAAPGH